MPVFKFVVSDGSKSYQIEKESEMLIGKKIGDEFDAEFLGLSGYKLKITGGSDKDGFAMRHDIEGIGRKRVLVSESKGFKAKRDGERKRISIRGDTIGEDIVQISCKIAEKGKKPLKELLGGKKKKSKKDKGDEESKEKSKEKPKEDKSKDKQEKKPEQKKEKSKDKKEPKQEEDKTKKEDKPEEEKK